MLDDELAAIDHGDLNGLLGRQATNEGIAAYLGETLGCLEVKIWRFERGRRFGALWRKES